MRDECDSSSPVKQSPEAPPFECGRARALRLKHARTDGVCVCDTAAVVSSRFPRGHRAHQYLPWQPQYPVFVGHKPGRNSTQRHRLDVQLILVMNRTLFIAARDHIYTVDIETSNTEEIYFSKKLTWKSRQGDVDTCRMKGKHKDECHNFIKVLLQQNDDSLFVCGTNAFNPSCRTYKMDSLDAQGEEISGMARCPYDSKHANVALFADGKLYSATVTDFLAIDAVIYRSLGDSPTLRTVKHDSKWLKEPYFVQAVDYGEFIYFFFREIAMEYNSMGKVVFPRVARICKNDRGGSQRVLEKQWTSFLKTRLNCSIPGDSHFYFNILQAVTTVMRIGGRDVVMATFSTPYNSIPGSAVCVYDMAEISQTFSGRFKEQKSPDATWTPVAEDKVPNPRPGVCASSLQKFKSSSEFPDDSLSFIKAHPLMDQAVPAINHRPCFLKTMVRYRLTRITVDNFAGPHKNQTVVFLGSERGIVLKFLAQIGSSGLKQSVFLEEISVYNHQKCSSEGVEDRRIVSMQIDPHTRSLFVAFSSCVVKVPLARCHVHAHCKKSCIASRDPYCGWSPEGTCKEITPDTKWALEQDVEQGNTDGLGDCQSHAPTLSPPGVSVPLGRGRMFEPREDQRELFVSESSETPQESHGVIRESFQRDRDRMVPITLLAIAVVFAFLSGAVFSGILVYCVCRRDFQMPVRKEHELPPSRRGSMNSVTKLTGLFETQPKDVRLTPLMHSGSKMLIRADLDLAALPTPESTPLQPRRKSSRQWERNQNRINIGDLPLRASPGQIPSVVVLPLPQNQDFGDLPEDPPKLRPQGFCLDEDEELEPPKVPQREASLTTLVPQMGKRLEIHYTRGFKQLNSNSSNSSPLTRSFRMESTPPPAPLRTDSIGTPNSSSSSMTMLGLGSLRFRPEVPPKPSMHSRIHT
ncbi:hypothetical protein DNTS_004398 [Danionella cerebrum]|uniref:Sema domain-containing protein n=1 Tax=Danionella cerebrum TaxID=2873325 RepID=A0A553NHB2_9TELE|nr:hypothetical protein DNTS_004398 [Danionella translucida]